MSEPIASPTTGDVPPAEEGEMLQFDRAEFATPAAEGPTCLACHQPIMDEYYEINQRVLCPQCRLGVKASFRGGSRPARFLKATAFGSVAAAVGAVLYYGFVRITHWNLGLISIVLGIMVGTAVRKGTGNRGGRLYQLLAVFLTYSSIVAMNVPLLIEAIIKHSDDKPAARVAAEKGDRGRRPAKAQAPEAGVDGKKAAPAEDAGKRAEDARAREDPSPPSISLHFLVLVICFFYAWPVLEATQAPITGLIYAFALWEAWKINKPVQLVFNGPFRLGTAGAADAGPEEVIDES
jgi:hypothetical protein